ncbi:integrase protein-related [Anaeramoeba flamelloides]|uniref:Integrase protein-related n=1 Tax=Anaeramoeba flamelloides TaxID=1746091 RepID=A0AAV7YZL3_9EUKA|nr:integrase protein-related [Anaeramoeba flamelloides]
MFFLDETGFKRNKRNYGWSLVGERPTKPDGRRCVPKWNMFCMMGSEGISATRVISTNATGGHFRDFMLLDVLPIVIQKQQTGSVIVMDNHPIHVTLEPLLTNYFRQFNCYLIYTPIYSPDLNPIEEVFGVLKQIQSVPLLRQKHATEFKAQKKSQITAQNSDSSKIN